MSKPKKILIYFPFLGKGGIERKLMYILQHLSRKKFTPILVLEQERKNNYWEIPEDINVICLTNERPFNIFWRLSFPYRIYKLLKIIMKYRPDIILSFMLNANIQTGTVSILMRRKIPLIWKECISLSSLLENESWLPGIKKIIIKILKDTPKNIICVSEGVKKDLIDNFHIPIQKIRTIYNPIDICKIKSLTSETVDHPWFNQQVPILIGCGRLEPYKNFSLMLKAARLIVLQRPIRVVILGDGSQKNFLKELARNLALEAEFFGFQPNPYKFMARATIFVLSSSYEGLPNVLLEAMACGLPVISTRCPYGPEEIITHGVNGLLVPVEDEAALAEAILTVLKDEALRRRLAQGGLARARDFAVENIIPQYEQLFSEVIGGSS